MIKPLIIGITGGSGSGKSYFVQELVDQFEPGQICLMTQDNYYRERDHQPVDERGVKNFDRPESIDGDKLYRDLCTLAEGRSVEVVEYTFNNPELEPRKFVFDPAPILIIEGLMVFYWKYIREMIDYSVFIEAEELVKVKRRIVRDAKERGYDLDDVLYRYEKHVAPFYRQYLEPLKKEVDIIIPNNDSFDKGLDILKGFISSKLRDIG